LRETFTFGYVAAIAKFIGAEQTCVLWSFSSEKESHSILDFVVSVSFWYFSV